MNCITVLYITCVLTQETSCFLSRNDVSQRAMADTAPEYKPASDISYYHITLHHNGYINLVK